MRVGAALHFVRAGKVTGVERYAVAALNGAEMTRPAGTELRALASRTAASLLQLPPSSLSRLPGDWRLVGEQILLPLWAQRDRLDLLHLPAFGGALVRRHPFVITVHDEVFWSDPAKLSRLGRLYYRPMVERALASARLRGVLFVSESARDAVLRYFPRLRPISHVAHAATTLEPLEGPRSWTDRLEGPIRLLSVGTVEPRKNLAGMARVVERLRLTLGEPVVWQHVGRRAWIGPEEERVLSGGVVSWVGVVDDAELRRMYRAADLVLSLSHAEGFNIPLVEGMSQGTPVVASDLAVHREVGRDGAEYVSAHDEDAAVATVARLLRDTGRWNERSALARVRGREFTPRALGARLWEIYRDALG